MQKGLTETKERPENQHLLHFFCQKRNELLIDQMSDINGIVGVVKLKLRANIRDEQIESGRGREWEEVEVKQAKKNSEPELS